MRVARERREVALVLLPADVAEQHQEARWD
jgi:hypothetical protein